MGKYCSHKDEEELELPEGTRPCAIGSYSGASKSSLLVGTSNGTIFACNDNEVASKIIIEEYGLHMGACTSLCISSDGRMAITAGEDGVIFVLAVSGLADAGGRAASKQSGHESADAGRRDAGSGDVV